MTFHQEVGIPFGLSVMKSAQLEVGLEVLKNGFEQIKNTNEESSARKFYQAFEDLVSECGIVDGELDVLVNHLFFTDETHEIITYVVSSYYRAGGDPHRFKDTYQLIRTDFELK